MEKGEEEEGKGSNKNNQSIKEKKKRGKEKKGKKRSKKKRERFLFQGGFFADTGFNCKDNYYWVFVVCLVGCFSMDLFMMSMVLRERKWVVVIE